MAQLFKKHDKIIVLGLFFMLIGPYCAAQKTAFWSNVRFGGGLAFGLSNRGLNASVSPSAIYQFNEKFATGASLSFNYAKFDDDKISAYGASAIALYNPLPFLQLSSELEQLRVTLSQRVGSTTFRDAYWSPGLFLGIGYTQRNFTMGIRYNVLNNESRSIYPNAWLPFVRVYF